MISRLSPIFGILAVLLWGLSFSAGKIAYQQLNVFELTLMRLGIASLCFFPVLVYDVHKNGVPCKKDLLLLTFVGFFAFLATLLLQFLGLTYVDASVASITAGLEGTFVMIISYLVLKQKPSKSNCFVASISMIGLIIVIGIPEQTKITGVFLIMMANVFAGISTVAQKPLFENISVLGITSWTVIISFLIISLGIPFFEVTNMEYYTNKTWMALLLLSVGATVVAYLLSTLCLKHLSTNRSAQFMVMEPIVGVFAAVILLGEAFTINIIIGTTLVVIAMAVNSLIDDGN
ncbi:MAG: DMT family transporter [Alphaproteobacteria bacterium]